MGRRQLCRIESFARGRQVTARFGVIDCRQSRLAKSRRILHDFVAFTVALVILICRRVQWFETRVRPANFNYGAVTYRRLRYTYRLLLTIIACTCREHSCRDADPEPLLTHCAPLTRFSTTFSCGCGLTLQSRTQPSAQLAPILHN